MVQVTRVVVVERPARVVLELVGGDLVTALAHTGDGWEVYAGQDEVDGCYLLDWVPADCVREWWVE